MAQGYCLDESNLKDKYQRNKVRHQLLPVLAEYNPRIVQSLALQPRSVEKKISYCNWQPKRPIKMLSCLPWVLKANKLAEMPPGLKRRVLRLAYEEYAIPRGLFGGSLSYEHTEAVLALKDGQKLPLPKGLWIYRDGDELIFSLRLPEQENDFSGRSIPVDIKEWQSLCGGAWQYRAEVALDPGGLTDRDEMIALPLEWLPRLSFRTRRDGDIFAPGPHGGA